jgi:uncharacterized protein YqgV (UPF0045/DUF77 family)
LDNASAGRQKVCSFVRPADQPGAFFRLERSGTRARFTRMHVRQVTINRFFEGGIRNMKSSVAIQVLPAVDSDQEVCRIVDEVIAYIASTGLNYYVGPCETAIEGEDYDQLMEIVKNCQKIAIKAGCKSVSAYVKINYRPEGEVLTIDQKIGKYHKDAE